MAQFGTFWSILNFQQNSSQIDEIINNPESTVETLLDEENIISEFKSLNPKLLDFMHNENFKKMLKFLIENPPDDADRNRGYKYPFVSCEILTADIQTLLNSFFGKNPPVAKEKSQSADDNNTDDWDGFHDGTNKEKSDSEGDANESNEKADENSENKNTDEETTENDSTKDNSNDEKTTSEESDDKKEASNEDSNENADENKDEATTSEEKPEEKI